MQLPVTVWLQAVTCYCLVEVDNFRQGCNLAARCLDADRLISSPIFQRLEISIQYIKLFLQRLGHHDDQQATTITTMTEHPPSLTILYTRITSSNINGSATTATPTASRYCSALLLRPASSLYFSGWGRELRGGWAGAITFALNHKKQKQKSKSKNSASGPHGRAPCCCGAPRSTLQARKDALRAAVALPQTRSRSHGRAPCCCCSPRRRLTFARATKARACQIIPAGKVLVGT